MKSISFCILLLLGVISDLLAQTSPQFTQKIAVWEYTFLKSNTGLHEQLLTYIEKNWFALDSVAVVQGLMSGYFLYDAGKEAPGDWNVVVAVAYPSKEGYEGIKASFEAIRSKHMRVPVDGKQFADLGRVVSSQKLYERTRSHSFSIH